MALVLLSAAIWYKGLCLWRRFQKMEEVSKGNSRILL